MPTEHENSELEDIRMYLDHCNFAYEEYSEEIDERITMVMWDIILSEKFSVHVKGDFLSQDGKLMKNEPVLEACLTKEGRRDDSLLKKEVNKNDEPYRLVYNIFEGYKKVLAEDRKRVEAILYERYSEIVKEIKSIPQWEKDGILQSFIDQVEDGGELSENQRQVIEDIREQREIADNHRKERVDLLNSLIMKAKRKDEEWDRDLFQEVKEEISEGNYLSGQKKRILAEKLDEYNIIQDWGPYVDDKRELI